MMIRKLLINTVLLLLVVTLGCAVEPQPDIKEDHTTYYPSAKPCVRWWWFATKIRKSDIRHQLDWVKKMNFGGVELAWVYPLYRYQRMYERLYNRHYPKDTTAQKWLSPEWSAMVEYTKHYADSLGLACDFTFGSAWPVAGHNIEPEMSTQVYGDSTFRQTLTFSWAWPDTFLVINHLDSNAFIQFADPVAKALKGALEGRKSALFTDSWEIKLNDKYKVWTQGFDTLFLKEYGYDIIPFMDQGIDAFPDVRYDYMLLLGRLVRQGFYEPYVRKCKELGAWSRVQCLASPTDVMTTYSLVDIPETEAMLNNPNYSRIVSSAATLSQKPLVSCESFTCMYGFPATYLREEQTADLKLVADALFAQGVNQHFYHGMPYNPEGSDTIEFFATTYFGPGGNLEAELPAFNNYIARVSEIMQKGKNYSDVAVYIPFEDGVMKGAYPKEKQRVWVWGEYELRHIDIPEEVEGYHPLWINRHFLEKASIRDNKLIIGDASFELLYIDVNYMDIRALKRILQLAQSGLLVCLKQTPEQPGYHKSASFKELLDALTSLPNVSADFKSLIGHPPLLEADSLPAYWVRQDRDTLFLFLAQWKAKDLEYPIYSGQSAMEERTITSFEINYMDQNLTQDVAFDPFQSPVLKITPDGEVIQLEIRFVPQYPTVRPREKQRTYF